MDLKIRGVEDEVVLKLNRMAKKGGGGSRNNYLKNLLRTHTLAPENKRLEQNYEELFKVMMEFLNHNSQILDEVRSELEKLKEAVNDSKTI